MMEQFIEVIAYKLKSLVWVNFYWCMLKTVVMLIFILEWITYIIFNA